MPALARRSRHETNIWPGFVDALATLLMVILFLVMIFVLAQFFLSEALSGRDAALLKLESQVSEFADLLALERKSSEELRLDVAQLAGELQSSVAARGDLISTVEALTIRAEEGKTKTARLDKKLEEAFATIMADKDKIKLQVRQIVKLTQQITALQALKDDLKDEIAQLAGKLGKSEASMADSESEREKTQAALGAERELSESARANLALLNRQMAALRKQLFKLTTTLAESESRAESQKVQISSLGQRLNAALASKVHELSRYRSEFFGRLREVLGRQPGINIAGDRFVFQSEVLFATGSADIGDAGKEQLSRLATTLGEISPKIPKELNWILRIDGHTDRVPINTAQYRSNWELSTARAISVVRFLIATGVPAERLAPVGFGENQPIDDRNDEIGRRRNRRIELKLTQR
jgi:chemotaxis protein MotB